MSGMISNVRIVGVDVIKKDYSNAQINFLPVCSECGHVLYGETVSVMADEEITTVPHQTVANREIMISPWRCKYCGARFDAVIMPMKLPFESPQDCTNCFIVDK